MCIRDSLWTDEKREWEGVLPKIKEALPELHALGAVSYTHLDVYKRQARRRGNVFAALVEAVKTHSLGQISHALYDVGGEYRRNM